MMAWLLLLSPDYGTLSQMLYPRRRGPAGGSENNLTGEKWRWELFVSAGASRRDQKLDLGIMQESG